jgi:hypothetical protein
VRIHEYCLRKKFSQRKVVTKFYLVDTVTLVNVKAISVLLIYLHMQASRACPGCGTEWPRQDGEADSDDDANEPEEDRAPSANRSSRKRRKGVRKSNLSAISI